MKNKTIIFLASIALLLSAISCNNKTEYKTRKVDNMFAIDVPTYMSDIDLENPEAALTVGDSTQERYIMVIYETKEEIAAYGVDVELDLAYYSEIVVDMFGQAFKDPKIEQVNEEPKVINDIPSLSFEIRGEFAEIGADIYSYVTVYESDKSFYTVYVWGYELDERNFAPEAHHIAESFKEI